MTAKKIKKLLSENGISLGAAEFFLQSSPKALPAALDVH